MNAEIVRKVGRFPGGPGVYLFLGAGGKALYVGKAANLRDRARSYLRKGGDGRPQLRFLESEAVDVEFVATATEQEALLLENTVIKKRKPTFNLKLKDDKAFLLLRLDRREEWPWFRLVRRRADDGAAYFGPYASAKSVRRTLRLLHKIVPLRDCRDGVFRGRSRPCIKHQIGRCPAPCVGLIERAAYDRLLDAATDILRGKAEPVLVGLRKDLHAAAENLEFERAGALKEQIEALQSVAERQGVVATGDLDADVFGLHRAGAATTVVVLAFRDGKLEGSRRFEFASELPDDLLFGDVLGRYYEGDPYVPAEIVLPTLPAEHDIVRAWLAGKRGGLVELVVPQRGARKKNLEMANENARLLDAATVDRAARRQAAAERLGRLLALEDAPACIHCLDVSTIQGRHTVASRVVFQDGEPDKGRYRKFKISLEHAGDDFAAMGEAVKRSLTLCMQASDDELPDLLLIDGGKGQLGAALASAVELGLGDDLAIAGLAKSRLKGVGGARKESGERIFVPGREDAHPLPEGAPETLLVAAIRDEAHRFAVTYHRKLRGKIGSELDSIAGIGPTRRRALLRHFGSLSGLKAATLDQLRSVPGLPAGVADRIHAAFASDAGGGSADREVDGVR